MEWWYWALIAVVVMFVVTPFVSNRVGAQYGSEEDFQKSGTPFVARAAEYHRLALEASLDKERLEKAVKGLDWELTEFRKWAERSGVSETESAINGAKLIERYRDEVREAYGLPPC